MGGEKSSSTGMRWAKLGSPPHGRGKAWHDIHGCLSARITPAWAGKSGITAIARKPRRDHPRMGGEKHSAGFS